MVQDFYQDNDRAQTSPSILVKDADISSFESDILDSRTIWYRPDGSLFLISDFTNGQEQNPSSFYRDGRLILQLAENDHPLPDTNPPEIVTNAVLIMQIFHDNGSPLMRSYKKENIGSYFIFYRPDGSPIVAASFPKDRDIQLLAAWSKTGKRVNMGAIKQEFAETYPQFEKILLTLAEDMETVFHLPAQDNPLRKMLSN